MKIGKATVPESAICASDDETIVVRGADLCRDLIGQVSFTDDFRRLITGARPSGGSPWSSPRNPPPDSLHPSRSP